MLGVIDIHSIAFINNMAMGVLLVSFKGTPGGVYFLAFFTNKQQSPQLLHDLLHSSPAP
jgi:hypothetical protein